MNLLPTLGVLLTLALSVPAAYARAPATPPGPTAQDGHIASSDDLLAVPAGKQSFRRAPWTVAAPGVSEPTGATPQADFVFADEVPLQAGMFDSPTAWEDEP